MTKCTQNIWHVYWVTNVTYIIIYHVYIYIIYTYNELLAVVGGTPYHNTHTIIQHLSTIDIQNSYWVCHVDKWYIACSYLKYIYICINEYRYIYIYNHIYIYVCLTFPSKPFPNLFQGTLWAELRGLASLGDDKTPQFSACQKWASKSTPWDVMGILLILCGINLAVEPPHLCTSLCAASVWMNHFFKVVWRIRKYMAWCKSAMVLTVISFATYKPLLKFWLIAKYRWSVEHKSFLPWTHLPMACQMQQTNTNKQTTNQTNKQTNNQTNKQTNNQTNKQTNKHSVSLFPCSSLCFIYIASPCCHVDFRPRKRCFNHLHYTSAARSPASKSLSWIHCRHLLPNGSIMFWKVWNHNVIAEGLLNPFYELYNLLYVFLIPQKLGSKLMPYTIILIAGLQVFPPWPSNPTGSPTLAVALVDSKRSFGRIGVSQVVRHGYPFRKSIVCRTFSLRLTKSGFPSNKGDSHTKLTFWVTSCDIAIIHSE